MKDFSTDCRCYKCRPCNVGVDLNPVPTLVRVEVPGPEAMTCTKDCEWFCATCLAYSMRPDSWDNTQLVCVLRGHRMSADRARYEEGMGVE